MHATATLNAEAVVFLRDHHGDVMPTKRLGRKVLDRDQVLVLWPGLIQTGLTILLSVIAYVLFDALSAKSVFLGGVVVIVPYLYFAARMKPVLGNSDSRSFLRAIAVAEVGKLILTMACCAVVFVWVKPLSGLSFFAAMSLVYFFGHMSLIFVIRRTT